MNIEIYYNVLSFVFSFFVILFYFLSLKKKALFLAIQAPKSTFCRVKTKTMSIHTRGSAAKRFAKFE